MAFDLGASARRARGRRRAPKKGKQLTALVAGLVAVVAATLTSSPAAASPEQEYSGPYFGDGNFPPGCIRDWRISNPANICYHAKTDMQALDSPKVDVLMLVPVSPTAEREMRIARQAVEMWEGGIDYLAPQMGLDWLAEGMDFHITVDYIDLQGGGGEFTTYPVVDPEIVVVVGNTGGPTGIGTDTGESVASLATGAATIGDIFLHGPTMDVVRQELPHGMLDDEDVPYLSELVVFDENAVPCHNVKNPFDFEYWEALPGFDSHHEARAGTYVEDCGGAGGNVCFTVAPGLDPAPDRTDGLKTLFDLVAHEFGHCLSLGHVGDGLEAGGLQSNTGSLWGPVPYSDIMSYSDYPALRNTCASTLNVETIALRMSRYLDVDGDGAVTESDRLWANDRIGQGGKPFQVQHPDSYLHASGTGRALDCPQPDLGVLPGERTNWTPEPVDSVDHVLDVGTPGDGAVSDDGRFDVAGMVERRTLSDDPTSPTASVDDARGDSSYPTTDVLGLSVELTANHLHATMRLAELATADTDVPVTYRVMVNGWNLYTHMDRGALVGSEHATWDVTARTVTFKIPRRFMEGYGFRGPYEVSSSAVLGEGARVDDDFAPEPGHVLAVGDPPADCGGPCPDGDGDAATGQVHLYVDGAPAARQDVDTSERADTFSMPVDLAEGTHVLRVDWEDGGEVVATRSVTVTHNTDDDGDGVPNAADACPGFDDRADEDDDTVPDACDSDLDGDGDANSTDNCPEKRNADQADLDGDGTGDVCDSDMDGDDYSNGQELAAGTDPRDPRSHPG